MDTLELSKKKELKTLILKVNARQQKKQTVGYSQQNTKMITLWSEIIGMMMNPT